MTDTGASGDVRNGARALRLALDGTGPPLYRVRQWLREQLPPTSAEVRDDAQLVATELVSNAYAHTVRARELRLVVDDRVGRLRIEVADRSSAQPVLRDPDPRSTGGRGLIIVDHLSSRWGVTSTPEGKTVWAELTLESSSR
ncbi:ATPase [Longimycelium tulufanense]|uniref:ATPase n=1 Tax=Longimycelium tulufanense TaxID=907463 RepID=A0A8J3FTZ4_9PSEU|nr:ATP-binding protein [Longimycelium tulufanense]GGM45774.1 ATPase [Longimycelium tulufanense]